MAVDDACVGLAEAVGSDHNVSKIAHSMSRHWLFRNSHARSSDLLKHTQFESSSHNIIHS